MNPGPRTPSEKHYGNTLKQTVHVSKGKFLNLKFNWTLLSNSYNQAEEYEWNKCEFEDEIWLWEQSLWLPEQKERWIILGQSDTPS